MGDGNIGITFPAFPTQLVLQTSNESLIFRSPHKKKDITYVHTYITKGPYYTGTSITVYNAYTSVTIYNVYTSIQYVYITEEIQNLTCNFTFSTVTGGRNRSADVADYCVRILEEQGGWENSGLAKLGGWQNSVVAKISGWQKSGSEKIR